MSDRPSSNDSAQPGPAAPGHGSTSEGTTPPGAGSAPPGEPPGLRSQFGRTRTAAFGLIAAHIDLAKAEFSEIAGEIKKAAMLGGIALGMAMMAGLLLTIGSILWLDEWIFGSIGWGVLHGTEFFLALTVLLLLAIIDLSTGRAVATFVLAAIFGAIIAVALGVNWRQIGDTNFSGLAAANNVGPLVFSRQWVLAVPATAIALAIVGLIVGAVGHKPAIGLFVGLVLGIILGWVASAVPGWHVAVAIGLGVGLVLWPIFAAIAVFRNGIDTEKLKDRFVPDQTIETTKETIEWVRAQTPLGRKS